MMEADATEEGILCGWRVFLYVLNETGVASGCHSGEDVSSWLYLPFWDARQGGQLNYERGPFYIRWDWYA